MFNNETLFHIHWVDKMNNTSNKMKISTLEYGNFSESANMLVSNWEFPWKGIGAHTFRARNDSSYIPTFKSLKCMEKKVYKGCLL